MPADVRSFKRKTLGGQAFHWRPAGRQGLRLEISCFWRAILRPEHQLGLSSALRRTRLRLSLSSNRFEQKRTLENLLRQATKRDSVNLHFCINAEITGVPLVSTNGVTCRGSNQRSFGIPARPTTAGFSGISTAAVKEYDHDCLGETGPSNPND